HSQIDNVNDAIKNNLHDLVSEESIIMSTGHDKEKIPNRSLDEYKIRCNDDKSKHDVERDAESEAEDVVALHRNGKEGAGQGNRAGDPPGLDYYEAEVSLAELEEALFKELELPNLEEKDQAEIVTEDVEFNDVRKKGLMGNVDKKRTILTALKRSA